MAVTAEHIAKLFTTKLSGGRFEFTAPTWFGLFLSEAEELYGKRDCTWTPLGIEVSEGGYETIPCPVKKQVHIRLSSKHIDDYDFTLFNLAHETIHVLGPCLRNEVTFLEEGVTNVFALGRKHYSNQGYANHIRSSHLSDPTDKYAQALNAVERLERLQPDAISKLRVTQKYLSRITPLDIMTVITSCPEELAGCLCTKFN